jgi:hypothetical protein
MLLSRSKSSLAKSLKREFPICSVDSPYGRSVDEPFQPDRQLRIGDYTSIELSRRKQSGLYPEGTSFPAAQDTTEYTQHLAHKPKLAGEISGTREIFGSANVTIQLNEVQGAYLLLHDVGHAHITSAGVGVESPRNLAPCSTMPSVAEHCKISSDNGGRRSERAALDWVEENCQYLERFAGEWLLVIGKELVAHSSRHRDILQILRERRPVGALIHYVPRSEEAKFVL